MAVIGYLGESADDGIVFKVSEELIRTPFNMQWGGSAKYATHERHATRALTEFTGLAPDTFSFDMTLAADLGTDVMGSLWHLWKYEREGTALGLVIGSHAYGQYRWTIQSHSTNLEYTDAAGDLMCATVSVSLLAYQKGEDQNSTAASSSGTPASSDPNAAVTVPTSGSGSTYTVKKGDCLWKIAQQQYGSGADYRKIYEANKATIGSNPNKIYAGQVLTIP